MPPKTKGKVKGSISPSFVDVAYPSSRLPAPFSHFPKILDPFLALLSKEHVYITSVDKTPRHFKAKIFAVPLLMNVAIIGLLLWRVRVAGPYYLMICYSLMGTVNETTMNVANMTRWEILYAIASRTMKFLADFVFFYGILWPWPRAFFGPNENENPMAWRFSIGFRDQEITIRRSRKWFEGLGATVTEGGEGSEAATLFLKNVRQATSRAFIHEKTGYSMLNKDWDLDWRLMILATMMVDKKKLSLKDFETTVLLHTKEFGWVVFEAPDTRASNEEDEGRRKILAFKDDLAAMGKENIFFRLVELLQFESTLPDGFVPERQEVLMHKIKEMCESQGVDFKELCAKMEATEFMPSIGQASPNI